MKTWADVKELLDASDVKGMWCRSLLVANVIYKLFAT